MVIIVDMREITLPYTHLAYFGGIVLDKVLEGNEEIWIIHIATLSPININNVEQLKDIFNMFVYIAEKIVKKMSKTYAEYRKIIISGRVPIVLLPYIKTIAADAVDTYSKNVYVFDPKLKKAFNSDLDVIEVPDEVLVKLLQEYDELVKKRHS